MIDPRRPRLLLLLALSAALGCGAPEGPVDEASSAGGEEGLAPEPCPAPSAPVEAEEPAPPPAAEGATCGTIAGLGCPAGQYCDYAAGDGCGIADGAGVCRPRPQACTMDYRPVCGCDGRTYGNACGAAGAGASVAHEGECSPP